MRWAAALAIASTAPIRTRARKGIALLKFAPLKPSDAAVGLSAGFGWFMIGPT